MSKAYLKTLYTKIYHENFSYTASENRVKMQKAIFLLQEIGTPIGDYSFFWYRHGLYSPDLQNAMLAIKDRYDKNDMKFSMDVEKDVLRVEKVLAKNGIYSQSQQADCIASVYYLQKYILPYGATDEQICKELRDRKPYFNNDYENKRALKAVKELKR